MNATTLPKFVPIRLPYRTQNTKKHLRTFELTNNMLLIQPDLCYTFGFLQPVVSRDLSKLTCHSPFEERTPCISSVCKNSFRILSKTSEPQNKLHRSLLTNEKNDYMKYHPDQTSPSHTKLEKKNNLGKYHLITCQNDSNFSSLTVAI